MTAGPLRQALAEAARERGMTMDDLTVMGKDKDPARP
jgi:hypothetical protein